ncbi:MAG: hypothetical protein FIA99_10150 [Ruminiclostridium sp.]|nr:hypothetical protein [Ruminiclostridium sp.]
MKKIISMILALTLIIGATSTTVFAGNDNRDKGKANIQEKFFKDSGEVSWAQKAIDKLKLKGLLKGSNGKYQPNRSATQLEAIIMSLRIMDWEDEALLMENLPKKYKGAEVKKWAVGYINKAAELGILDDVDLMYFKPNAPVKRHEIAKYIIRALQKENEAKAKMNADLPFVDAAAVPQGSVGYVYLINDLGIMKGDGKRFNPMGTLSRAEMAVLFYNLDERVDNDNDIDEFRGIVDSIGADELVLKIGALKRTFDVSNDVVVYKAAKKVAYSTVVKGAKVILKTIDGVVEYIEILNINQPDDKIITNYTGELMAIGSGNPATLTVKIEEMTAIFKVADGAEFYFKGVKGTLSDLRIGDKVRIAVDNVNRALKVVVDRQIAVITQDQGKITAIDLMGTYHLSINSTLDSTTDSINYILSKDADVKVDNVIADFEDLAVGMDVIIKLENSVIESVYAES